MPDYQLQEEEEFIRRNYGAQNQNHVRKIWRQNPNQNNPVLMMEAHENRTCLLDSEMQVSPPGRIWTSVTHPQNLEERIATTAADHESRMLTSLAPPGYPTSNLNNSSFLLPSSTPESSNIVDCDTGALSVISGYQSCAAEALRYLVEEEGLSSDDPLVAGLRSHLGAQKRLLDPESVFRNYVAAMAQRLMESEECDDVTDEDLSESEEEEEEEGEQTEDTLRHLASDICDALYYGGSKMNVDECDTEPEVRWFESAAPPTYHESMYEDYGHHDITGAPSPSPSI